MCYICTLDYRDVCSTLIMLRSVQIPAKARSNLYHVADVPQVSSSTMFLLAGMFCALAGTVARPHSCQGQTHVGT